MRDRLKELDLRITELSGYLHISRPTMYRFIENYENGKTRGIDKGVLNLFRYIENNPLIGKKNVITYIIENFSDESSNQNSPLLKSIRDFENGPTYSKEKADFLQIIANSNEFDDILPYLNNCLSILLAGKYTDENLEMIGKFVIFRETVRNDRKLTKKEFESVKKIMECE